MRVTAVAKHQLPIQRGRPAPHVEPARQYTLGVEARVDAVGHRRPDPQQPGAHLGLGTHRTLVAPHDLPHRRFVPIAQLQQLVAGAERQRHIYGRLGRLPFALHESAADRVVHGLVRSAVAELDGEPHRVGVPVLDLGGMHADVRGGERDRSDAAQHQRGARVDRRDLLAPGVRVDVLGRLARQAQHHCAGRAVPRSGGGQRSVQVDTDPDHRRHTFAELLDEALSGTHRPDGVRTRRTHPDREEVEDTDSHRDSLPRRHRVEPPNRPG